MINLRITVPPIYLAFDKKELKTFLRQAARIITQKARALIRGASDPSKPGGPPTSRTGQLAKNIAVRVSRSGTSVQIISHASDGDAYYGRFLEVGAQGGGGKKGNRNKRGKIAGKRVMARRPFLSTALESQQATIEAGIGKTALNGLSLKPGKRKSR